MKTLAPFQEDGARFLAREKRAFLGDEAGLGKTLQAIRACDHIGARRVLIVCPPSVVENWRREFNESSLLDPALTIMTPVKATQNRWFMEKFDAIILDEAHYYKTPTSQRTKAIYGPRCEGDGIVEMGEHVFLLSGSPLPNDPSEMWAHVRALRPELIPDRNGGPLSNWRFKQIFCQMRQTPFGPKIDGIRPSKIEQYQGILERFMLRRLEDQVDLLELRVSPLYVEARIAVANRSDEAEEVRAVLESAGVQGLKGLTAHATTLRRLLGMAKIDPTIEYVEEWLKNNDGKICVYAWHREVIDVLVRCFKGCATISGGTTNRQAEVDRFQTDDKCRVFVGQIQAAGEAITLTKASEILIVEPSWVPKDNYQVIKRIHRIGQTKPCAARFVTVAGTIDDAINKALARKEAMIGAVLT